MPALSIIINYQMEWHYNSVGCAAGVDAIGESLGDNVQVGLGS